MLKYNFISRDACLRIKQKQYTKITFYIYSILKETKKSNNLLKGLLKKFIIALKNWKCAYKYTQNYLQTSNKSIKTTLNNTRMTQLFTIQLKYLKMKTNKI